MNVTWNWLADPPQMNDEEEEPKRYYGVVTGQVVSLLDEMQLGRVQVKLPFLDDLDVSPWARIAVPMSGVVSGVAFLPQVGDEVLVAFEQGDVNVPYVIGSLWNGFAPPPPNVPVPNSPVRTSYTIRTVAGNQILITEDPPSIQILSPLSGQNVIMENAGTQISSTTGVEIAVAGATITVTSGGVEIVGANISLTATTAINLAAPAINIAATGNCTISGGMVMINP